jgi:hypothetical protein
MIFENQPKKGVVFVYTYYRIFVYTKETRSSVTKKQEHFYPKTYISWYTTEPENGNSGISWYTTEPEIGNSGISWYTREPENSNSGISWYTTEPENGKSGSLSGD